MSDAPDDGTEILAKHKNVFGWCIASSNGCNGWSVAQCNYEYRIEDFEGWYPLPDGQMNG